MNTEYYQEFLKLCESMNYSVAAEELSMSDASLSRHIQALESELGVRLFDRTSRTVVLNRYGRIFEPYARQFVSLQQQCQNELLSALDSAHLQSVIYSSYFIDDFLLALQQYDPRVQVSILNSGSTPNQWLSHLQTGKCELAFISQRTSELEKQLVYLPFQEDQFVAVMSESHPLAGRDCISISELAGEHFVSLPLNSLGDYKLKELCREAGFEPQITFNTRIGSSVVSVIRQSSQISILLKKSISKMDIHGVRLVDLSSPHPFIIYICYKKKSRLSPGSRKIIEFATQYWNPS